MSEIRFEAEDRTRNARMEPTENVRHASTGSSVNKTLTANY